MNKTTVRLLMSCFLVVTLLFASCSKKDKPEETSIETETTQATYTMTECPFEAPEGYDVECGYLTVPENRSKPDGRTIDICFAIFRTTYYAPEPDPIVYLAGGPGENALESASLAFKTVYAPLMKNRDLIIIDQRGTGYSKPSLACPEFVDMVYENLDCELGDEEATSMQSEVLRECYDRFVSEGIDLSAYNSAESAADLNDLRIALGYEEWNLLGVSYGTRLALTAMRDYPGGIRSVILCSTYPLEVDLYSDSPKNIDRALQVLFDACAGDPESNKAYPNLEDRLYEVAAGLNDSPVLVQVMHPLTRELYEMLLDGDGLIDTIITSLYSTDVLPLLPKVIFEAGEGKYDTLALLMSTNFLNMELISLGMYYAVQFNEEMPFTTPEAVKTAVEAYPEIRDFLKSSFSSGDEVFEVYDYWHRGEVDPVENKPVSSDIPSLILSGEYDPITPPEWGKLVSGSLENSYFFEFPGIGHDTIFSSYTCVKDIVFEFLDDPAGEPDSACVSEITGPDFVILDVNLVPYTSTLFGFEGVYPERWIESSPGAYQRTELGLTALIEQAAPGVTKDTLVGLLASTIGLDEDVEPSEEFSANGMEWSVYKTEVQTLSTDLALAEKDGTCYLVLFSCVPDDHPYYYNELVLPAIKALVPLN
ncbi:MAG: alpha/beta fold hydrolase [Dehalococcoidales bacterium]|nr:alpha/beta fold hydrolase [Dehalococcoidales bacterium]